MPDSAPNKRGMTVGQLNAIVLAIFVILSVAMRLHLFGRTTLEITLGGMAVILGCGLVAVLYGTAKKNKWGMNFDPVICPRCGTSLPQVRVPKTVRQALWGGGTCQVCGTEVDKWGREVPDEGTACR